jgi:prevent-host-death family protein
MNKIIGVTQLQRRFRVVFDEVVKQRIPYVLTRGSRPEAVLLPYDEYMRFVQADEAGILRRFDVVQERMNAANSRYSDDEVEADLRSVSKAVRARRRKRG